MKKALILAALVGGGLSLPAKANPPESVFNINQTSPSVIQFDGTGTAQFNSSKGTNNQFNVGSNTNLGVSASLSSTAEIQPQATASLDLGMGSQLQQTIGTSSNAANAIAVQSSSYNAAYSAANSSEWGSSYEAYQAKNRNSTLSESEWRSGWENKYQTAYDAAQSQTRSALTTNNSDGVISGKFTTIESANNSLTASQNSSSFSDQAEAAASSKFGVSYGDYHGSVHYGSEAEWKAARSAEYDNAYNKAVASAGFKTESTVEVKGIGSIATVNAAETSKFNVDLSAPDAISFFQSTATANGSAGANLSTSSYATQNSASTASAFIQAFGSGTGQP